MYMGTSVGLCFKAYLSDFDWLQPVVLSLVQLSMGLTGSLEPLQLEH